MALNWCLDLVDKQFKLGCRGKHEQHPVTLTIAATSNGLAWTCIILFHSFCRQVPDFADTVYYDTHGLRIRLYPAWPEFLLRRVGAWARAIHLKSNQTRMISKWQTEAACVRFISEVSVRWILGPMTVHFTFSISESCPLAPYLSAELQRRPKFFTASPYLESSTYQHELLAAVVRQKLGTFPYRRFGPSQSAWLPGS